MKEQNIIKFYKFFTSNDYELYIVKNNLDKAYENIKLCFNTLSKSLTSEEVYIINQRFGITVKEKSLKELSDFLSLKADEIAEIERVAIRKLKHPSNSKIAINILYNIPGLTNVIDVENVVVTRDTKISELNLSKRCINNLTKSGVITLAELLELSDDDVLKLSNKSRKALVEIENLISEYKTI